MASEEQSSVKNTLKPVVRPTCVRWLYNVLLLIVSLLITMITAELVFRIVYPLPSSLASPHRPRKWQSGLGNLYLPNSSFEYWVWDEKGHQVHKSKQQVNAWGFTDQPVPKRLREAELRIVIIGDSYVEALQVSNAEKLGFLLEESLNDELGVRVEVITLAKSGTGQAAQYAYWRRYREVIDPDIVISVLVANDIRDNHPTLDATARGYNPLFPLQLSFIPSDNEIDGLIEIPVADDWLEHRAAIILAPRHRLYNRSALARFVINRLGIDRWRYGKNRLFKGIEFTSAMFTLAAEPIPTVARQITFRLLEKYRRETQSDGAQLILLGAQGQSPEDPLFQAVRTFDRWITEWAAEKEVEYVSFFREASARGRSWSEFHWAGDNHWNQDGHLFAARLLEDRILRMLRDAN